MTQKQEPTTSLGDFFNDDELQVAEILGQLPQLVVQDKFNTSFLPLWGSKGLRSVLVNIPPPVRRSSELRPPIVPRNERRAASNGQPPILPTLPSSSNAEAAHERKKKWKKKHRSKIINREQELIGKAEQQQPPPPPNLDPHSEMNISVDERERESMAEYEVGLAVSKELSRVAVPVPVADPTLVPVPEETLLMGCFFQPFQLQPNQASIYAEARKRRKLQMKKPKISKPTTL